MVERRIIGKSQIAQEVRKMGTIGRSLTLRAAIRSLARSGQDVEVSVGDLVRAVSLNIMRDPMVRNRDAAIRSLWFEAEEILTENEPVKKGSTKWYAMVNSGLDPVSGKAVLLPVSKEAEHEALVQRAIAGVEAAIARTMKPRVTKIESPHRKGTLSIREASRMNSGLHPTEDKVLF